MSLDAARAPSAASPDGNLNFSDQDAFVFSIDPDAAALPNPGAIDLAAPTVFTAGDVFASLDAVESFQQFVHQAQGSAITSSGDVDPGHHVEVDRASADLIAAS